jgi:hypothetical protein
LADIKLYEFFHDENEATLKQPYSNADVKIVKLLTSFVLTRCISRYAIPQYRILSVGHFRDKFASNQRIADQVTRQTVIQTK